MSSSSSISFMTPQEEDDLVRDVEKKLGGQLHRTAFCITCGVRATNFCGHVKRGVEIVLAGWCKAHAEQEHVTGTKIPDNGCHGKWTPAMGISREF
jgi:hypothetical protein